jgi:O-antigen/teichoic acid export membrane protein
MSTPAAADADRSATRQLLGKGSVYTLATAAQLLAVVPGQLVLAHLLSAPQFGRAALGLVVIQLVGMLVTVGLPAVVTREYFVRRDGADAATALTGIARARALVALNTGLSVVVAGVVAALGPLWAMPVGGFDTALLVATGAGASFAVIQGGQALQRARGEAGRFVLVAAVNSIGGQAAGLALAATVAPSATGYLAGVAAGYTASALLCMAIARPSLRGLKDRVALRGWFAIALPTLPHLVAMYLMTAGDRFIVTAQLGDKANGAYTIAYLIGAFGIVLVNAANNAWAPLVYGAPEESRWQLLATTTRDMLRLAACAAAGLALTAPLALALFPSNKYDLEELIPVVAVTALATVPMVLYLAGVHTVFWSGKTTALLWIAPVAVAVNLVGKALVLKPFGFVGAAVVTVAAYVVLAVLVDLQRRRIADVPWTGRTLPAAGALVLCLVGALLPDGWVGWSLRALGTVAVLAVVAYELRAVLRWRKPAVSPG